MRVEAGKNIGFHSVVSDTESCERSSCSNRVVHITALLVVDDCSQDDSLSLIQQKA